MSKPLSQNQKTFNKVVRALRKQGCKSQKPTGDYDGSMSCLYRGPNNTKCAAGHLIPNKLYDKRMEGQVAKGSRVSKVLESCGHDPDFVCGLQFIHDSYEPAQWEKRFQIIADKHRLKVPPLPLLTKTDGMVE